MEQLRTLWRRRPLRVIGAGLSVLALILGGLGVVEWESVVSGIIGVIAALEAGQPLVTPVADPRNRSGRPLAPALPGVDDRPWPSS